MEDDKLNSKEEQVESLIYDLKELKEIPEVPKDVCTRQVRRILKKQHAKQARTLGRKLAKAWKELITLKQKSEEKVLDERWSISEEVEKLFKDAIKLSFPEIQDEEPCVFPCIEEEHGDFQCENVLSIWPSLRKKGTVMYPTGPIKVGQQIKMYLQLLGPQLIERPPRVHAAGFITIKLLGKFMAKGLHKMLRDGIDTWAPKLLMERVKVNFPSCDMDDLLPIDLLRRELIKETSISMLKFCKIDVEFSKPCEMALPKEENDKFRVEKREGGDVLIFRNHGGEEKPLIHAKRDGWSGINPMEDVADLWYGLQQEEADWIIWVTPIQQLEYVNMCIKAAKHAGWLPLQIRDSPRASYTGFKLFDPKLKHEDLSLLLDKAKSSCEAAAVELGYTGEQAANCALKFNSQDMLDPVGNTFVYLLNTQFRICSLTNGSSEAIKKLKRHPVLKLGKGQIWKEGLERVLVQHLLRFTEVILAATLPVFPHLLCEYVYDLSKKFNSVFEIGFVKTTTNFLLCEATRVVLDKCFELLGLTPQSSSLGQALSSLILTERTNHKDDPPKVKTRIELFSLYPYITSDRDVTKALMFGRIGISDAYSVLWEQWGLADTPDHGFVCLFDRNWSEPVKITSDRPMYLDDPFSKHLVPFSWAMETCVEFYAFTESNDAVFDLGTSPLDTDFEDFLEEEEADTKRCVWISKGDHGCVRMYYILLKNAVDSCVMVVRQ